MSRSQTPIPEIGYLTTAWATHSREHSQTLLPATGYLRLHQILALFPIAKSSWWRGVKEGRYPKPVKLGPRTTAWRVEDIAALMEKLGNDANVR